MYSISLGVGELQHQREHEAEKERQVSVVIHSAGAIAAHGQKVTAM